MSDVTDPVRAQMEEGAALRPAACRAKGGAPGFKVAVVGAAGGIGQSLSLLMKMNPLVSVLHLYDVVNTPGVTADVSHMDTSAVVTNSTYLFSSVMNQSAASDGRYALIIVMSMRRMP